MTKYCINMVHLVISIHRIYHPPPHLWCKIHNVVTGTTDWFPIRNTNCTENELKMVAGLN